MGNDHSPEVDEDVDDDFFKEVYAKEYTGPPQLTKNGVPDKSKMMKRPISEPDEPDEEDEAPDPNAVPTDFTSREAKVWEAKAKAIERNWKKRKEEEMICKICGEAGHFTQGCPSTLGGNRKSAEFFERVAARDKHVRALFSQKVMHQIEKDIGCKLKMDEKFLVVSGKDRLILAKGVDAVHKVIQGGNDKGKDIGPSKSRNSRSRSPDISPAPPRKKRESSKSHCSPRNTSHVQRKGFSQEKVVDDQLREDLQKLSRVSPKAFGNGGVKRHLAPSKSPPLSTFATDALNSYDVYNRGMHKNDHWGVERHEMDRPSGHLDFTLYPQTLEELEVQFTKEAMDLRGIHDKEEDEENCRHREHIKRLREDYVNKAGTLRNLHTKQWEELIRLDVQGQRGALQHLHLSGYAAYDQAGHMERGRRYLGNTCTGSGPSVDSRGRYQYPGQNYPHASQQEGYSEYQLQRSKEFWKAYGQY